MILARNDIIVKLEECLAGQISAASLATWAFDLFYAIEQDEIAVDETDSDVIAEVLDDLMFADDPSFVLDEADLQRLIARL
jgi:hypothetical protein